MSSTSIPTDIAAVARADRRRHRAQARKFRERRASNLEIYVAAYERRWRFIGGAKGRIPSLLPRMPRRLLRYGLTVVIAGCLASPAVRDAVANWIVATTLVVTEPVLKGGEYLDRLDRRRRCALQRLIFDTSGELVGLLPPPGCAEADRPRYRSTSVDPALAAALAVEIQLLEGQYHIGRDTVLGWHWRGWMRGVYGFATRDASLGGGSSPIETAAKNVADMPGQLALGEKLKSGWRTVSLTTRLSSAEERDAFVLESTPCARGAGGSEFGAPVAGGLCFQVLFGLTNPKTLSSAQRCVVAASYQRLALIAGPDSSAEERAEAQTHNNGLIARAALCLSRGPWTNVERRGHEAELKRIAGTFPFKVTGQSTVGPADPAQRARARLAGAGFLVADQLKLERLPVGIAPVQLTLSSAVQNDSFAGFNDTLRAVEPRLGGLCAIDCTEPTTQVDAAVVVSEMRGGESIIVAGIATKHGLIGGRLQLTPSRGYEPLPPTRGVGSLNKSWLSWLIARSGISHLCNRYFQGVRNPGPTEDTGVQDCNQSGAMMPVASVYAHSKNLPFLAFVAELGADALRALAEGLGLSVRQGVDGDALLRGFVLGNDVVATPATMIRNFAALYEGGRGASPVSSLPNLVSGSDARDRLDLTQLGFDSKSLQGAAKLLHAPIYHPARGTLRTLGPVLQRLGCERGIAKSGTSESAPRTGDKGNRDRMLLAAFRCDGRDYVVFGMIGSPDIATSLGAVTSADVAKLIEPVLAATLKKRGPNHAAR